eukprot:CAMPEP_0114986764 /NCGR_PEP_ID=MMETSP0216-20121206/8610_1 /TAXON_ID=223996 /ORGANISM="Protocruzia adherens, Strain Boccale" /LENGTH=177 /DNA_ID=CAMNT_0002349241 /DNA_START=225 /DNA_END=758 /DNA_ORIENTATION=-
MTSRFLGSNLDSGVGVLQLFVVSVLEIEVVGEDHPDEISFEDQDTGSDEQEDDGKTKSSEFSENESDEQENDQNSDHSNNIADDHPGVVDVGSTLIILEDTFETVVQQDTDNGEDGGIENDRSDSGMDGSGEESDDTGESSQHVEDDEDLVTQLQVEATAASVGRFQEAQEFVGSHF